MNSCKISTKKLMISIVEIYYYHDLKLYGLYYKLIYNKNFGLIWMPYRYSANIFLSSTSKDLQEERKICVEAINRNYKANNMENWGASPLSVKDKLVDELDKSAAVVLILGFKYGSVIDGETISYTEFEFDYSIDNGLPILSFIKLNEDGEWVPDETDDERKELLKNFKSKIEKHSIIDYFGPEDNLKEMVAISLSNNDDIITNNVVWTDKFFEAKLFQTIENLSGRYNADFNIDMKMDFLFDAISKNESFKNDFKKEAVNCYCNLKQLADKYPKFKEPYSNLILKFKEKFRNVLDEDFQSFAKLTSICHVIKNISHELYDGLEDEHQKLELADAIEDFDYFIKGLEDLPYGLVENPFLLLVGDAGVGKSHLLANLSKERLNDDELSILLLGSYFGDNGDIGQQIVQILDLDMSVDEFLHYLNEKAKKHKSRILIIIDALNECNNKELWKTHLNGFVNQMKSFSHLGLIVSIRSTYIDIIPKKHSFLMYNNFNYDILDAVKIFCEGYNIPYPSFPILHHEFSNPLFLRMMFDNLSRSYGAVLQDKISFFDVINEYIQHLEEKIHFKYHVPQHKLVINEFIDRYVEYKIKNINLTYDDALDIGDEILRSSNSYLIDLLIEENLFFIQNGSVAFVFEKIGDYLTSKSLLMNVNTETLFDEFKEGGNIFNVINNNFNNYLGVFESFAILIPEKFGIELFEIDFSDFDDCGYINGFLPYFFIHSLYWRKPESVRENVYEYIETQILPNERTFDKFMDVMILLSYNEQYTLNAEKLHEYLFELPLNKRDSIWTTWIHNKYVENESAHKLVSWVLSLDNPNKIPKPSLNLISLTLSWFLSSTNNKLRDDSTHALIYLLKDDVDSLINLLNHFEGVNDLYIYERLLAVAYGVALRNRNFEDIKPLVKYIYNEIFCKDNDYTHILLRDYARSIIEYGMYLNEDWMIDESKLWMNSCENISEIPTDDEINVINEKISKEGFDGYKLIYHSMNLNFGDFGIYVFKSNFDYWGDKLNVGDLQKIALKQVFELYDEGLFGKFDKLEDTYRWNRHYSSTERIGKKYQWIVFYNLLGIVSENYKLKDSWYSDESHYIGGAWEIDVRNFDPSINFKNNVIYENPLKESSFDFEDENWSETIDDLMNIEDLLIQNIFDDDWLLLFGQINWSNGDDINFKCGRDKSFYIDCQCWVIKKENKEDILNKLEYEKVSDIYLDHNRLYQVFDREYSWSKSFNDLKLEKDFQNILYRNYGKGDEAHLPYDENIYEIKRTTEYVDINNFKPSKLLFENLNLKYGEKDNVLYSDGEPAVIDLSSGDEFIYQILINNKKFISFLDNNDLDIIWLVSGKKLSYINGSRDFNKDLYLNGIYHLIDGEISGKLDVTHYHYNYIANNETNKVHLNSCEFVEEISKESCVGFDTVKDAINDGFEFCPVCMLNFNNSN